MDGQENAVLASGDDQGSTLDAPAEAASSPPYPERKLLDTITFRDRDGSSYVWPIELCSSYDAIQPLLKEIYTRKNDDIGLKGIEYGRYEMTTLDDRIISPNIWTSIIKPGTVLQMLLFNERRNHQGSTSRTSSPDTYPYRSPPLPPPSRLRFATEVASYDRRNGRAIGRPRSPSSDGITNSTDEETTQPDLSEDEWDYIEGPPPRLVVPALDAEGNKLSHAKDTARPSKGPLSTNQSSIDGGGRVSTDVLEDPHPEILRVTKALTTGVENRSTIQLHNLLGPESPRLHKAVSLRWYHVTASSLDFNHFRHVCLGLPSLSERRRAIVSDLLARVEKEFVKIFLDGMFIEPGSVMRVDEQGQTAPESVIFSCIPYLRLAPLPKKTSTVLKDRKFPSRTLIQSYYPYEPVRDRDAEQAYKKFGDDQTNRTIHVPNLWMVNIASDTVVTYGHEALAELLVKSIEITQDAPKTMNSTLVNYNTNIRVCNADGRTFLFPVETCRTYFQLEQKVLELKCSSALRYVSGSNENSGAVKIELQVGEKTEAISPHNWSNVITQNNDMFINVVWTLEASKIKRGTETTTNHEWMSGSSSKLTQPIFQWPWRSFVEQSGPKPLTEKSKSSPQQRSVECLEKVEKGMLLRTLPEHQTSTAVDRTFTSTTYYQSLPEETWQHLQLISDVSEGSSPQKATENKTLVAHHATVILNQCVDIRNHLATFLRSVHETINLFVGDVDQSVMLRKVWGAMACTREKVLLTIHRGAVTFKRTEEPAWFIRNPNRKTFISTPEKEESLAKSVRRCRQCKDNKSYPSYEAALKHLRNHQRPSQQLSSDDGRPGSAQTDDPHTSEDWIVSYGQRKQEESNAAARVLLVEACKTASEIRNEASDLVYGVRNENNKRSDLYSLPPSAIEAFREILIFYLAIERAIHFNEESFQKDNFLEDRYDEDYLPHSDRGLRVLRKFGDAAKKSLRMSRHQLCFMVRSAQPIDINQLSLNPEYVCSWLMRRLIVKPLDKQMTVGDMYREYLSTIQFQVNHRPGKRLLRDINLLQEELNILLEINSWQKKLINNYMCVLDDSTFAVENLQRKAMFSYEQILLQSCLDDLQLVSEDYADLIRRCGPLSNKTKQSLEINEEDHGKAIMVFTVVTVIFLPLSFASSYLGMNTADIRDMGSNQSLFYIIAIPLTVVTVGICVLIGYNGDELRDLFSSVYHTITGKGDQALSARGISVAQRKRIQRLSQDASTSIDYGSLADEAEFANPQPQRGLHIIGASGRVGVPQLEPMGAASYQAQNTIEYVEPMEIPERSRIPVRTHFYSEAMPGATRLTNVPEQRSGWMAPPQISVPHEWYRSRKLQTQYYDDLEDPYLSRFRTYQSGGRPPIPRYAVPRPTVRPASMYSEDEGDEGYTWHKKGGHIHGRTQPFVR